jgi:phosphoglycolate phosphatase
VPRKPDPTSALALAERLGAAPADCWLVGDTAIDIRTASAAGMRSIAVGWGSRPLPELALAAPDRLARDVGELAAMLGVAARTPTR